MLLIHKSYIKDVKHSVFPYFIKYKKKIKRSETLVSL